MRARLLLAAIVVPAFTLFAQWQSGGAESTGATTASLDDRRFDITLPNLSGSRILERFRSAVLLGVLDTEAGAADDVGLPAAGFKVRWVQVGGAWVAYAESEGEGDPATRADIAPARQRTPSPGSGCWWLWVLTGIPLCSEAQT